MCQMAQVVKNLLQSTHETAAHDAQWDNTQNTEAHMTPTEDLIMELERAVRRNDLRMVKQFATQMDVTHNNSYALHLSAQRGLWNIAAFLLPFSNKKDTTYALLEAIDFQRTDIVKLLLPRALPKSNKSEALQYAVATENQQLIDLIYPKSNPHAALKAIYASDGASEVYNRLAEIIANKEAVQLKERIVAHVDVGARRQSKKM